MYKILIRRKTNKFYVKKVKPTIKIYSKSKRGLPGADGTDGTNGTNGVDGESAYQIWLDNGNTGTEQDFLDSLHGADGADGIIQSIVAGDNITVDDTDPGHPIITAEIDMPLYDAIVPDDYATLSDALDNMSDNQSVFVRPGTYSEAGGSFALNNITINGAGIESVSTTLDNDLTFTGDFIYLHNLTIDTNSGQKITFTGGYNMVTDTRVKGGTVDNFFASADYDHIINNMFESDGSLGTVYFSERNNIVGNLFTVPHKAEGGVYMKGYSAFTGNMLYALSTSAGGGPLLYSWGERAAISGNMFFCKLGAAVSLDFRCGFTSNSIFQGGGQVITATDGSTITGNTINISSAGSAVFANGMDTGYSAVITGNNISSDGANPGVETPMANQTGIRLGTGQVKAVISGNSIAGCGTGVFIPSGATDTLISSNAFSFFTTGVDDSGTNTTIVNNSGITNDATVDSINGETGAVVIDKSDVGLANVDNTSDANKPVSTAQATAIGVVQTDIDTHEANTSNPHSVTKTQVGLSNVDNTSDVNKPISSATQASLDSKIPYTQANGPTSSTQQYLDSSNVRPLRHFHSKIANRNTTPVDIFFATGDSLFEGTGVSTYSNTLAQRFIYYLRKKYPQTATGGRGVITSWATGSSLANPFPDLGVSATSNATSGLTLNGTPGYGLDSRTSILGAGKTRTFTFVGTGIDISVFGTAAAAGVASIAVDGTNYGTVGASDSAGRAVLTAGAGNISQTVSATNTMKELQIRGLTATSHTVVITGVSGSFYVNHWKEYNGDENSGFRIGHSGTAGKGTKNYIGTAKGGATAANPFAPGYQAEQWLASIAAGHYLPDLIFIDNMANDYAGGSTEIVSAATNLTNLQSIITKIKAAVVAGCALRGVTSYVPSFVITPPHAIVTSNIGGSTPGGGTMVDLWSSYRDNAYTIAATDADKAVAVFDYGLRLQGASNNVWDNSTYDGLLWSGDKVHPSDIGNDLWARQLLDFATPVAENDTSSLTPFASSDKKLYPAKIALRNRLTSRFDIGIIGASLVEGAFVSTYSRTIGQQLAALLRAQNPTAGVTGGGRGYIPIPSRAMTTSGQFVPGMWPIATTGGFFDPVDPGASVYNAGGNHMLWYTNTTGKIVDTLSSPVTSFDIHYSSSTSGGASGGYYKIDGGASVFFSTLDGTLGTVKRLHVASPATSTIEVGWNSNWLSLTGITEYNGDENSGIQVHNYGHSGYDTVEWNAGATTAGSWRYFLAESNLDLLILQDLGANDAGGGYTPAQVKANITTFIATLRAGGITCPIILTAIQDISGGMVINPAWSNYVQVMREVAAADSTVAFVDLTQFIPSTALADTYGLWSTVDHLHPAPNGKVNTWIAEIYASYITGVRGV